VEQNNEDRNRRVAMTPQMLIVLLTCGAVLAGASLLFRVLTAGKYEVQTIDLIFLVIPLLVVALATNRVKGLDLFGIKLDFADKWIAAGQTKISDQVSGSRLLDALDELATAEKGSVEDLRRLIGRRIEALEFKLRLGTHTDEVIRKYFDALSGSLRVVVVNEPGGKLFAIYNAPDLISSLRFTEPESYGNFANMLNIGNEEERAGLAKLPGFVSADNAVTKNTSKRDALAAMEALNTDILPVVDEESEFIGTVGRSKLTAGLILSVTNQLEDR
jgi:CBS domain-containing protein